MWLMLLILYSYLALFLVALFLHDVVEQIALSLGRNIFVEEIINRR